MNTRDMTRVITAGISRDISFNEGLVPLWSVDFTSGATGGMTFSRASGATAFNSSGGLVTLASNVPRLDYHPTTLKPRGLLIEEGRTNYLLNSAAPVTQTVTLAAGTFTLWLVGSGSCVAAAGTAVGTGFGTATASGPVSLTITTAGTVSFTVSGSVVRFQCENGSIATSFIVTTTAAATRVLDGASFDTVGSWYNPAEGTLTVEFETLPRSSAQKIVTLQVAGSENDLVGFSTSTTGVIYTVRSAALSTANLSLGAVADFTVSKIAAAYKQDDFACCKDGGTVLTDTAGAVPAVMLTQMLLGNRGTSQMMNGWLRKIAFYPSRLSNTILQQLTS